jgi:hypothetical protein
MNKGAQGPGSVGKTVDYMAIVVNPGRERVNGVWDVNGNKVVKSSLRAADEKKSFPVGESARSIDFVIPSCLRFRFNSVSL